MGQISEYTREELRLMGGLVPEPVPQIRWRLIDVNFNLSLSRFLAVQVEGSAPAYAPNWREVLSPLADGEFWDIGETGVAFGGWRSYPPPLMVDGVYLPYAPFLWDCPLCDETNGGETCRTSWCRLTPAQATIAASWFLCRECGCGSPEIHNSGEKCPACRDGDVPERAYMDELARLRKSSTSRL